MSCFQSSFVTVMLHYEGLEKNVRGPAGTAPEERFGWIIQINGLMILDPSANKPQILKKLGEDFPSFVLKHDDQLEVTCFEDPDLSYETHDQFHPPMSLVTKVLDKIAKLGYINTSSTMTAEKNEVTYCVWNFQRR